MNKSYIIVLVVAIVLAGVVLGAMFLMGGGPKVIEVELREFSFAVKGESPPLRVKAGEPIIFKAVNRGVVVHELMIVSDKDRLINLATQKLAELYTQYGDDIDTVEVKFKEWHEEIHMKEHGLILKSVEFEPGESKEIQFTFEEPGTYWLVCMEIEATYPQTHADQGMFLEIIVE